MVNRSWIELAQSHRTNLFLLRLQKLTHNLFIKGVMSFRSNELNDFTKAKEYGATPYRIAWLLGIVFTLVSSSFTLFFEGHSVLSQVLVSYLCMGAVVGITLAGAERINRYIIELLLERINPPIVNKPFWSLLSSNQKHQFLIPLISAIILIPFIYQLIPLVYQFPLPSWTFIIAIVILFTVVFSAAYTGLVGARNFADHIQELEVDLYTIHPGSSPILRDIMELFHIAMRNQGAVLLALVLAIIFSRPTPITLVLAMLVAIAVTFALVLTLINARFGLARLVRKSKDKILKDLEDRISTLCKNEDTYVNAEKRASLDYLLGLYERVEKTTKLELGTDVDLSTLQTFVSPLVTIGLLNFDMSRDLIAHVVPLVNSIISNLLGG